MKVLDRPMGPGPSFRKFRTVAFSCIALISLAWTVLATVVLYMHWGDGDAAQTSLIVIILCVEVLTVVMLPASLLLECRAWVDAARLACLIIAHFFAAIAFTIWAAKYDCPTGDDGVCNLMNIYVSLASWVIPLLLVIYTVCFSIVVWRRSGTSAVTPGNNDIEEATTPRRAALPIMQLPDSPVSVTTPRHPSLRLTQLPWVGPTPPPPPLPGDTDDNDGESDTTSKKRRSTRSSARLSKPLPSKYFS